MNLPAYLYHGSMFDIGLGPLQPGFNYTHVEVFWDEVESNKFLYATTSAEEAVVLGFGSMLEKRFDLDHFQVRDKTILVKGSNFKDPNILDKEIIYLYTLRPKASDGWIKNNNHVNGIATEWKTNAIIPSRGIAKASIPIRKWLDDHGYMVVLER
jgi:hypothetical protein